MSMIKICGLTKTTEADYLNEAKVDYAGFVFFEKSKRNITIKRAEEIFEHLSENIKRVAVCVSPDEDMINMLQGAAFDVIQIHGELNENVLRIAKKDIWYAVNIEDEEEYQKKIAIVDEMDKELSSKIKAFLVDAPSFGSGKPFNWRKSRRLLKAGAQSPPINDRLFILAGGLNANNVQEGINIFNPDIVDVSSGVEGDNGKDREKILAFAKAVRKIDDGGNNE